MLDRCWIDEKSYQRGATRYYPSDLEAEGRKQVVFERCGLFWGSMNCMVSGFLFM